MNIFFKEFHEDNMIKIVIAGMEESAICSVDSHTHSTGRMVFNTYTTTITAHSIAKPIIVNFFIL